MIILTLASSVQNPNDLVIFSFLHINTNKHRMFFYKKKFMLLSPLLVAARYPAFFSSHPQYVRYIYIFRLWHVSVYLMAQKIYGRQRFSILEFAHHQYVLYTSHWWYLHKMCTHIHIQTFATTHSTKRAPVYV